MGAFVLAILAHAAELEPMNSTHAAVSDHKEIASVAACHVDDLAFGAPPPYLARLERIARHCGARRALELSTAKLSMTLRRRPRPERRNHMNEPYLCPRGSRDRHGQGRQVSRVLPTATRPHIGRKSW